MTLRYSLLLALIGVVVMRALRGGWSRDQLRKDGMAVLVLTALILASTKVIGL